MWTKLKHVLGSTRFWAIIGIAVIGYLKGIGYIEPSAADSLIVILGGYAIVKTSQNFQYPE